MGLFSRGRRSSEPREADFTPVEGEQLFVGEASYQDHLVGLLAVRGHSVESLSNRSQRISEPCVARMIPETDNQYDSNAVGVHVDGKLVAYLSRANAARYREAFGTSVAEVPAVLWVKANSEGIVSIWPA